MWQNPFTLMAPKKANKTLVQSLLRRQCFEFTQKYIIYTDVLDLIDRNPLVFNTTSFEVLKYIQNENNLKSNQSFPNETSLKNTSETLNSFANPENPLNNILLLNCLAKMKSIQLKIFTVLNRKLTAQKIGSKSQNRIYLFSDEENNFVLLQKSTSSSQQNAKSLSYLAASACLPYTPSNPNSEFIVSPEKPAASCFGSKNSGKLLLTLKPSSEWACFADDSEDGLSTSNFLYYCDQSNFTEESASTEGTSASTEETSASSSFSNPVCQNKNDHLVVIY